MSAPLTSGFKPIRRDQLYQEREHDAYRPAKKPVEPSVCPDCGAVFRDGRWQWTAPPPGAHEVVCAACQRIRDHFPAGFVQLDGGFVGGHRAELMALLRHHEAKEKAEHPLVRMMDVEDQDGGVLLTTTDIHLARDLGEAVHRAYRGELEFHYNEGEKLLRVHWRRDA
ncbi:MAG TPA: BCAM0308 family protein [Rhodocyclaceae bacterium]